MKIVNYDRSVTYKVFINEVPYQKPRLQMYSLQTNTEQPVAIGDSKKESEVASFNKDIKQENMNLIEFGVCENNGRKRNNSITKPCPSLPSQFSKFKLNSSLGSTSSKNMHPFSRKLYQAPLRPGMPQFFPSESNEPSQNGGDSEITENEDSSIEFNGGKQCPFEEDTGESDGEGGGADGGGGGGNGETGAGNGNGGSVSGQGNGEAANANSNSNANSISNSNSNSNSQSSSQKVHTIKGKTKRMDELEINDWIFSASKAGFGFSRIVSWLHRMPKQKFEFIKITLENGKSLEITKKHYIYKCDNFDSNKSIQTFPKQYIEAESLQISDCLLYLNNRNQFQPTKIKKLERIFKDGIYAPLTDSGNIIVNGILA
uniref:Hint domain-containing protein n=1 Tax=Panagrolaimus sp. ES5 TaxID=591445 RepID=A0AC34G0B1_9BILA